MASHQQSHPYLINWTCQLWPSPTKSPPQSCMVGAYCKVCCTGTWSPVWKLMYWLSPGQQHQYCPRSRLPAGEVDDVLAEVNMVVMTSLLIAPPTGTLLSDRLICVANTHLDTWWERAMTGRFDWWGVNGSICGMLLHNIHLHGYRKLSWALISW